MASDLTIVRDGEFYVVPDGVDVEQALASLPRASAEKCKQGAIMLFSGLKERKGDDLDAMTKLRVYERTLARFPGYAVDAAIEAFLIGEVQGQSKAFVPSTAELATECKRQMFNRIRREKPRRPEQTQEEYIKDFRERWDQLLGKWKGEAEKC